MAQPNVAREPSMEEILASIRRIIESNEPGAGNALSGPLPAVYIDEDEQDEEIHLTVEDDFEIANDRDAAEDRFAQPSRIPPAANQPEPAKIPERALSLADVAARVRAASNRAAPQTTSMQPAEPSRDWSENLVMSARMVEQPTVPEIVAPVPATVAEDAQLSDMMRAAAARDIEAADMQAPFAAPTPADIPALVAVDEVFVATSQPVLPAPSAVVETENMLPQAEAPQPAQAPAAESRSLAQTIEAEAKNLLSPLAGQQVAASFSELAAAFDGIQRQSLEELAGEMMRPLLQEWLDDNLPTLVERLVREEIERVARGPRR